MGKICLLFFRGRFRLELKFWRREEAVKWQRWKETTFVVLIRLISSLRVLCMSSMVVSFAGGLLPSRSGTAET